MECLILNIPSSICEVFILMLYCVLLFNYQLYDILFQKPENALPRNFSVSVLVLVSDNSLPLSFIIIGELILLNSLLALCLPKKKNLDLYIDLGSKVIFISGFFHKT